MASDAAPATIPSALNQSDLKTINIDDDPRVAHTAIASRLGTRPQETARLIERNRAELEAYGEVCVTVTQTSERGGRPGREYWLNEGQSLVICALSRTPLAADIRRQVIQVYMDWRRGHHGAALPQAGHALVRLGDRTVTIDLADPAQGGEGPWLVTPHGRTMPEIVESGRFDGPSPVVGAVRTIIIPDGPGERYATLWGRVVGRSAAPPPPTVTDSDPRLPCAQDEQGRPLYLDRNEVEMVMLYRMQAERAVRAAVTQAVNAEVARLRRDIGTALSTALDRAIIGEYQRREGAG